MCIILGFWQIERYRIKKAHNEYIKEKLQKFKSGDAVWIFADPEVQPFDMRIIENLDSSKLLERYLICGFPIGSPITIYNAEKNRRFIPIRARDQLILFESVENYQEGELICLGGVLDKISSFQSTWILRNFFSKPTASLGFYIDKSDLENKFPDQNISEFYLADPECSGLFKIKSLEHHIYYSIMWFAFALYAIYAGLQYKKVK